MKPIRLFVVAILLLNLGVTLGADFFGKEAHLALTVEEVNDYRKHNLQDANHLGCDSSTPEKSHCPDPCHLGQPHFGHIAFLSSISSLAYIHFENGLPAVRFKSNMIDGPFIEGPRRPPKQA